MNTTDCARGSEPTPRCSVLVVNFNGQAHLRRCLQAFAAQSFLRFEILVIDNGSDDGSHRGLADIHPSLRVLSNPANGYAAALNLGLREARGEFVVFANNDVFPEPDWMAKLVETLERKPAVGCVGGKLLFEDGRINSVGHRPLPDFYWEDEGFGEEDTGQYETPREVDGVCWAAAMFRRTCIDELCPIDEDYVLYYEDVDTSLRCRQAGWKIEYVPGARAHHRFHGSSKGPYLTEWFCDRNRLLFLAKFRPDELPNAIRNSRFLVRNEKDSLQRALVVALTKLQSHHPREVVDAISPDVRNAVAETLGTLAYEHLLRRVEVIRGKRRMRVTLYDHALHVLGGGQRYGLEMAACLADELDVELISNQPIDRAKLEAWYDLSLAKCTLRTIRLPFFERRGGMPDANLVRSTDENPFDAIANASAETDVFVNVNMLPLVRPLAPFSIFLCHFPDIQRRDRFAVDDYSYLITNSEYTTRWTKLRWGLDADTILYPPVAMQAGPGEKQNIILSAARFEVGGSKKQHVLVHAFEALRREHPDLARDWSLHLVGGSIDENPYRDRIARLVEHSDAPIEMHVNVPAFELKALYARARIFWHACGLGEDDPHLVEHFGMTTVEAMQNACVPIVFDGGGLQEIVERQRSGHRFGSLSELVELTHAVMSGDNAMRAMSEAAMARAQRFSREAFQSSVRQLFSELAEDYAKLPRPDPRDILREAPPTDRFLCHAARRGEPAPPRPVPVRDRLRPRAVVSRLGKAWQRASSQLKALGKSLKKTP